MSPTSSSRKYIQNIVIVGVFAAMCYVVLFFKIPIPAPVGGGFLHFGNTFVILAALLFTGVQGGLAGSIGMGLNDLTTGYAAYAPKTIVLKFGIGLTTGLVFSCYKKKPQRKSPLKTMLILAAALLASGCAVLYFSMTSGGSIHFDGLDKPLKLTPILYLFLFLFSLILFVTSALSRKMPVELQYALLAGAAGVAFNLAGEFVTYVFTSLIAGSPLAVSLLLAAVSLPATVINGVFSIIGAVILYVPLKEALRRTAFFTAG